MGGLDLPCSMASTAVNYIMPLTPTLKCVTFSEDANAVIGMPHDNMILTA